MGNFVGKWKKYERNIYKMLYSVYKNVLNFLCIPKNMKYDDSIFKRYKKYQRKIK